MNGAWLPGLALALLLPAAQSLAERVQVPLSLDSHALESLLRERVFTANGDRLRLNDDGSGCQYLDLRQPRVTVDNGQILLRTTAEARAGRAIGGRCLLALDWRGDIEFVQRPQLDTGAEALVLHTDSWRALRPDGSVDTVSTTIGRWIEQFLPADLKNTRISFAGPMAQLREVLGYHVPAGSGISPDSLGLDAVQAGPDQVTLTIGVDVAPAPTSTPAAEPALTEAEIAQLEQQLASVDAFFTYTIRNLDGEAADVAPELLAVLVELRRDLTTLLREPARLGDASARRLFMSAWEGLAPVLHTVAAQQTDYGEAVRYLTFVGAGDALRALDEIGPAVGIDISAEGLRRLARLLIPDDTQDPLDSSDAVDAQLRRSLGFGDPLPPPQNVNDTTWIDRWLDALIPPAMAAGMAAGMAAPGLDPAIAKRLNNWVPKNRDMSEYLPMVRDVLEHVVAQQLKSGGLDDRYRKLFRWLVFAAAWQESCWRQFEAKNDKRVPVQSGSGDLGVMQINPRVWRGLYDLHGLRWDIVYNARAGADILQHYLTDYALRHREHERGGNVDNLARATYAAYNGGPRQYARYRSGAARADELFYQKYQQVKQKDLAVFACYGG